jgi:hypothetical protein
MTLSRSRRITFAASAWATMLLLAATVSSANAADPSFESLLRVAPGIDRTALKLAMQANACAQRRGYYRQPHTLTVIDYSKPSTVPRLWVFDLRRGRLLFHELVAHGRDTGFIQPVSFSNRPGSNQSSLGLFMTLDTYRGGHGRALRLRGLEPGFNDRAYERKIVIHGAPYVNAAHIERFGRLGRSLGCPVLSPWAAQRVISTIQGSEPVFAYYPDAQWLRSSRLLDDCDQRFARN